MRQSALLLIVVTTIFVSTSQNLAAEEWIDISARDTALGGAGNVLGRSATGAYYNPANVGRRPWERGSFPKFEFDIPVGVTASVHGISYQRVFNAVGLAQDLNKDFENGLFQPGNPDITTDDIGLAFQVFDTLDGLRSFSGDGIYAGAAAGVAVRISDLFLPRDGIAVRVGTQGLAAATALVDLPSLRGYRLTDSMGADFESIVQSAMTNSGGDITPSSAGGQQFSQQLQAAGYSAAIADGLAAIAENSGIGFSGGAADVLFDFLVNTRNGSGTSLQSAGNPLEGNKTGFLLRGAVVYEVGISYGFGLPVLGLQDWLSLGVTAKYLQCYTFSQALFIEDFGSKEGPEKAIDDLVSQLQDTLAFQSDKAQINFGLDLGVVLTPRIPFADSLAIALSIRNLNAPEFTFDQKLPGAPRKFRLDAQARAGASYTLFGPTLPLTFAVEMDLNPVSSNLLPSYHTQFFRAGISFEPNFGLFGVGVRVGALKNLADSEQPLTFGAGFGLLLVVVKLDFGVQYTFSSTLFGGDDWRGGDEKGVEIPQRAAFFGQLGVQIGF